MRINIYGSTDGPADIFANASGVLIWNPGITVHLSDQDLIKILYVRGMKAAAEALELAVLKEVQR